MKNYEFWKNWKNKTEREKRAIYSIKKAEQVLFENIPKNKIYAIYIKGSFVRREMNEKSDVDIIPITYDNKTLEKIKKLEETIGQLYKPSELLPHSLKEFEAGKRYLKYKTPKGGVDMTLRDLYRYKLIYGKPIDIQKYPMRTDLQFLIGQINAFKDIFIPNFKEKKMGFSELVKQTTFLVEKEQRIRGIEPPESWKELAKSIKNKNHIIHDVLKLRLNPTKDNKKREKFLRKLNKYIFELEKLTN
ncbi:MAG: nucleotidyltransferase domain-containing protein [Candidatus Nanoarchaeia archaeon]